MFSLIKNLHQSNLVSLSEKVSHENLEVLSIGLCVDPDRPWYGASPDASVNCSCCGYGVIEVKCPYTLRDCSLKEKISSGTFYIELTTEGTYKLRTDHQYYYQVQLEIHVTRVRYCDFMVWTPSEYIVLRIEADESFVDVLQHCDNFWETIFLRELITRRYENDLMQSASSSTTTKRKNKRYCICDTEYSSDGEEMVGCDACDNWFHLSCYKLKKVPKNSTWYCRECRVKKKKI